MRNPHVHISLAFLLGLFISSNLTTTALADTGAVRMVFTKGRFHRGGRRRARRPYFPWRTANDTPSTSPASASALPSAHRPLSWSDAR